MRLLFVIPLVALTLSSCAPTSQTPDISNEMAAEEAALQRELVVKQNMKMARRLDDVSAPILMANAELCGDMVTSYIGTELATKDAFSKEYQQTMADLYGVDVLPTITMIAKNSPAYGKLKIGDMINQINGQTVPQGRKGLEFIQNKLEDNEAANAVFLDIDRRGEPLNIRIQPVLACDSPVRLSSSDAVNAAADGKSIIVTKGMMRFVENDTELATVVGHELAHNSRAHIDSKTGNAVIGGILGAAVSVAIGVNITDLGAQIGAGVNSQAFEAEADYVGLYHTARAGYNISSAPNLWRRIAASNPGAIHLAGSTHPSTAKRFLALEATVKEINAKKARGEKLIPEEREVATAQDQQKSGLND